MAKDGDFTVSAGHQYGLYAGLLLVHGLLNSLRTSQLAALTRGFVFAIVAVTLMIPLLLLFLTPLSQMNSPKWVFTHIDNRAFHYADQGWTQSTDVSYRDQLSYQPRLSLRLALGHVV